MAFIALKWFAGMVPRLGRQHLSAPHATEAENCNLYSGELRPLNRPALTHQFCEPGDACFVTPKPPDPSIPPPEPPPEPPACVAVAIVTQPVDPGWFIGANIVLTVIVNADATAPVQYQWYRDNIAIAGAVETSYSFIASAETSNTSYTVGVQNPCGQALSTPVVTPFLEPGYACDALQTVFDGISTIYFLNRGYASDVTDVGVDYSGPAVNIATATPYPNDGYFRGVTSGNPPSQLGQCTVEDILWYPGSGSNYINHQQNPGYVGLKDDNYMGGMFWPAATFGGNGLYAMGYVGYPTYIFDAYDIRWRPDTGYIEYVSGDLSDGTESVRVSGTSAALKGYDGNNERKWTFITWRVFRTATTIQFTVWASGVQVIQAETSTTIGGQALSTIGWYYTDDGSYIGTRTATMGASQAGRARWYGAALYTFVAGSPFDPAVLPAIQQGLERQMLDYLP